RRARCVQAGLPRRFPTRLPGGVSELAAVLHQWNISSLTPLWTHSECFAHDIVPKLSEEVTISEKVSRSLRRSHYRHAICQLLPRRSSMNSHYLSSKLGRIALALFFLVGIGMVASTTVQAQQWPYGQDPYGRDRDRDYNRDRDYRRNDRYGRNGNVSQIAFNQGYQDGTNTGSNDAQRGQNYNPQRSHFYR